MYSHDTYHMPVRRFTWSYPTTKKPRNLLLCMRSQRIIIMMRGNHQVKPIQV